LLEEEVNRKRRVARCGWITSCWFTFTLPFR
jgi:hypothetical protein